ncbi:MAG: TRAP transporter small permease [Castellaniella sp.]|uniref:TRAP transporter small permease subunit n=1 Tax=Castellaniella sp. TaxID=1955812 RepID=UPI002A36E2EA|nr:TRAP transporter small permease [Castellaniella sp.]MDY0309972.1 TRAP transporter small permease [Castellaniella sp.]
MPSVIRFYARTVTALNRGLFMLSAALMAIIVPAMMVEVLSRYLFHAPTVWGMELAVLLFGPYFLLGGPYLLHLGGHVNMDLFRTRMSQRIRTVADVFSQIVILFFCAVMLYYATPLVLQSIEYRETTFSAWNPPLWPYKLAVPLSMLLLALQSLAELGLICLGDAREEIA